jgi:ABC-type multidrug transport system ATPase subunit
MRLSAAESAAWTSPVHIELRRVSKKYDKTKALDDVSLQLPPGRIVALIGLNGAGKTTLLRCLGAIVAPSGGEVLYDDQPFLRSRIDLRRRLMLLPDFPALYGHMSALEHIALMARIYERDPRTLDAALLKVFGELDLLPLAEAPIGRLSRGQIYKVALAALVLINPELWLLDEPFASGLDPQGLAMLKDYARAAAKSGATVIYSTQILEIAERFADQLCVIDRGQLRQIYTRADLDTMPATGPDSLETRLRQFREVQPRP